MANNIMTIKITKDNTKLIEQMVEKAIGDALELCGQQAERNAKKNLEHDPRRVDTGLLRNSITHAMGGAAPAISSYNSNATHGHTDSTERRGIAGTPVKNSTSGSYSGTAPSEERTMFVGTNVSYGPFVEYGTQRMTPNHFLRNALHEHIGEYKTMMERCLRKALK